jgi:hypothetical protein
LSVDGLVDISQGNRAVVRELPELTRRKLPARSTVRLRMPTPEERAEHRIPEGVPVAEVTTAKGETRLYIGDRDELAT